MAQLDVNPDREAEQRSASLARYEVLDTPPEPVFDDIVLLAARICEAPVALVSLVASDRQWFKARVGFHAHQTPLSQSVCAHTLSANDILVIPDLTRDDRTRTNPLVLAEPFIRFYAGAVMRTPSGDSIGALCVIDTSPRPEGLSALQAENLQVLARQVVTQLELRRYILERETALRKAAEADVRFKHQQKMLKDERQHRLKNVVAVVQSVVHQTLRYSPSIDAAREAVSKRLRALVKGQEVLFLDTSDQADLTAIVRSTAELYQADDHPFIINGPEIQVGAKAALGFSLILNELATNAMKYGALSSDEGVVTIEWVVTCDDGKLQLNLSWQESGGPAVSAPTRRGFGTTLIEQALPGADTQLQYQSRGLNGRIRVPLDRLAV